MDSKYEQYKRFLSKKQERELFYRMKDGDEEARDELILAHAYLVIKLAKRYENYGPVEDLEQEGWIALTKAVDVYDIEKGRLRAYAHQAVKTNMVRFLAKNKDLIKLPEPQVNQLLFLLRMKDKLMVELQREPTYEDLMQNKEVLKAYKDYCNTKDTKFNLKEYVGLIEFSEPVSSLNYPVSEESGTILEDMVSDPRSDHEHELLEKDDVGNAVMDILEDQEKFILQSFARGMTGKEIGDELGITTQSVSARKINAIAKIKKFTRSNPELKEIIESMGFNI